MANYSRIIKMGRERPLVSLVTEMMPRVMSVMQSHNIPHFSINEPSFLEMGGVPVVLRCAEYEEMPCERYIEMDRPPWEPRNVTNFPIDKLGWYVMAIEECGHPGVYIEKDAYTSTRCKLPDDYALMRVGNYDMTEFWHIFDELQAKYPVCPEVSIQDVGFGKSAECQKLIDEMRHSM